MIKKYKRKVENIEGFKINRNIESIAKFLFFIGKPMKTGLGYKNQDDWKEYVKNLLDDEIGCTIEGYSFAWGDYIINIDDGFEIWCKEYMEKFYEEVK